MHLPEKDEPWLSVRDYGKGLDYLGIVSVFANFGTSTKRDSDNLIGGFGIGSKSGLAISDAINVTSVCNGLLNEFVLERTPNGIITRFAKENEPTTDESGTTITIKLSEKLKTDWDEFKGKDLVTKAYYTYANKHCSYIDQSDVCEIIDHITKTCASEIDTLKSMCDDLDKFIK